MLTLLLMAVTLLAADTTATIIPETDPVHVDGIAEEGEWSRATQISMVIREDWRVEIYIQRDDGGIAVMFEGAVSADKKELYPEVMFNIGNSSDEGWDDNDHWFHVSYNDCYQKGRHSIWDCEKKLESMEANNFPLAEGACVELYIPYSTLGISAEYSGNIGLCFNLTDTISEHTFWPEGASIDQPASWAHARFSAN